SGDLRPAEGTPPAGSMLLAEIRERCRQEVAVGSTYEAFAALGIEYGPAFRGLQRIWRGEGEALGLIELPGTPSITTLLDAALQLTAAALPGDPAAEHTPYLPLGLGGLTLHEATTPTRLLAHVVLDETGKEQPETLTATLRLCDEEGALFAEMKDLRFKKASSAA